MVVKLTMRPYLRRIMTLASWHHQHGAGHVHRQHAIGEVFAGVSSTWFMVAIAALFSTQSMRPWRRDAAVIQAFTGLLFGDVERGVGVVFGRGSRGLTPAAPFDKEPAFGVGFGQIACRPCGSR